MIASRMGYLLCLLYLTNLAIAVKYRFSIQEVRIASTRDIDEDDVLLVVASFSGTTNNTNNWSLGSVEDGASIKWDNLTQEIDVPSQAANLSVAIGISNTPDQDEQKNTGKPTTQLNTCSPRILTSLKNLQMLSLKVSSASLQPFLDQQQLQRSSSAWC